MTTETKIQEVQDYLVQSISGGFGLSIGRDHVIVDVCFESLVPEQITEVKQYLSSAFSDIVDFS